MFAAMDFDDFDRRAGDTKVETLYKVISMKQKRETVMDGFIVASWVLHRCLFMFAYCTSFKT